MGITEIHPTHSGRQVVGRCGGVGGVRGFQERAVWCEFLLRACSMGN